MRTSPTCMDDISNSVLQDAYSKWTHTNNAKWGERYTVRTMRTWPHILTLLDVQPAHGQKRATKEALRERLIGIGCTFESYVNGQCRIVIRSDDSDMINDAMDEGEGHAMPRESLRADIVDGVNAMETEDLGCVDVCDDTQRRDTNASDEEWEDWEDTTDFFMAQVHYEEHDARVLEEFSRIQNIVQVQDAAALGEACEAAVTGKGMDTPVNGDGDLANGDLTTRQVVNHLVRLKLEQGVGKQAMNDHLKVMSMAIGAKSNMPNTLWHLERFVDAKYINSPEYEIHVCPKYCRTFDNDHGAQDEDETCGTTYWEAGVQKVCDERRYHSTSFAPLEGVEEQQAKGGVKKLHAQEVFYYIPIKEQLLFWASKQEFWERRASVAARDPMNMDFWGGKLAKHINDDPAVQGRLLKEEECVPKVGPPIKVLRRQGMAISAGYDHYPVFNDKKKKHSTGIVAIQLLDVEPSQRFKTLWQRIVAIHPGPGHSEKSIHVLFEPIVKELRELMTEGMLVQDTYLGEMYKLFMYLGYWNVDTIARMSLAQTSGVAGYLPDWRYAYRGKIVKGSQRSNEGVHQDATEDNEMGDGALEQGDGRRCQKEKAMRLYGYAEKEFQPWLRFLGYATSEEDCMVWANDERLLLDHDLQMQLSEAVRNGKVSASRVGRLGLSPMADLPYVHMTWHFAVPFIHSVMYGVVKNFWKLVFGKIPGGQFNVTKLSSVDIKEIKRRSATVQPPSDGYRAYACIVNDMGTRYTHPYTTL